jgi:TRAP transporter 4TM/12TM fusion protein
MGAAAFIMAEFLGLPYIYVAIVAIFPAFLYFFSLFLALHYDGKRDNQQGIPEEMIPKTRDILNVKVLLPFLVPVITLIVFLSLGFTEARAGFWAIFSLVVIYVLEDINWSNMKARVKNLSNVLEEAGKAVVLIALLAATSQILVSILSITGLGVKITGYIVDFSGASLFLAVILSGIVVIVLGMGMPTTAAYVLGASVVAPALITLGVLPIAAHMFVLYYAVCAAITPPVCAGVFVAAGLAQAKWFPSSLIACKLGVAKFIIPIAFIYSEGVLLQGKVSNIILSMIMFILASWLLTMGLSRYAYFHTTVIENICLIVGGLLVFTPNVTLNLIGIAIAILGLLLNYKMKRNPQLINKSMNPSDSVS